MKAVSLKEDLRWAAVNGLLSAIPEEFAHSSGKTTVGSSSRALGSRSHALGSTSHALGSRSHALGSRSHAQGNTIRRSGIDIPRLGIAIPKGQNPVWHRRARSPKQADTGDPCAYSHWQPVLERVQPSHFFKRNRPQPVVFHDLNDFHVTLAFHSAAAHCPRRFRPGVLTAAALIHEPTARN